MSLNEYSTMAENMEIIASLTDESVNLLKFDKWRTYGRAVLLTASLSTDLYLRLLVLNYTSFAAPKDRPINKLMIVEQTATLLSSSTLTVLAIISVVTSTPLEELFGWNACVILWISAMSNHLTAVFGGLGMAIFRFMFICFPSFAHIHIGKARLAKIILLFQGFSISILMRYYWKSVQMSETSAAFQFCTGQSPNMAYILYIYNGGSEEERQIGLSYQKTITLLALCLVILELVIYTSLFRHLLKHDKSAVKEGLVSADIARARTRRNVITLSGQAWTFLIEVFMSIFIIVMINSKDVFGLERIASVILTSVLSALLAILLFLTSPELKRYYLE